MARNNLRIVYQNLADTSTITATSTASGTTTANLKLDAKSLLWRSTGTTVTLTVTLPTSSIVSCVILPFCNLTKTATISIVASGMPSNSTLACPYTNPGDWASTLIPSGTSKYSYGGGTYARVYFTPVTVSSLQIIITDSANSSGYVEASRLIVGNYWSPTFNTSFGLSVIPKDMTTNERSEAGDLVSNRGITYNTMSFDLKYLNSADRVQLLSILKGNGKSKAIFISLFPEDDDEEKEGAHQIYGKLVELSGIQHTMFGIYSSTVDIEEV